MLIKQSQFLDLNGLQDQRRHNGGNGQIERIRVTTLEGSYLKSFLIEMSAFCHR